ncbi:hypothetical protein OO015_04290 [Thermomicrobium sp. 4228-Ro]|uniref:hypothetical protein n=1 Tax=Thermomicrobium sp. 4228-Ro TaxID=2993937 RepID=UPI0022498E41|nr:hypothetical protein [Thermomicrobium sp. 4228-Ro]MCX2726712.1 hypothetical protein [Thermomicrobium sp. 4228-Ro]
MIPFPAFQLMSLVMVLLSVRALGRAWRVRKRLFAEPLEASQLGLLVELALFVLVPISVLLHEAGHAVAVWLAGGQVTGFGYLLFLGWVEYTGVTDARAQFWITLSGNLVSVGLGLAAVVAGLFAPLRRSVNALLLVAGGLVLATSLVFYPLLDFATGLHGDWVQLYSSGGMSPRVLGLAHAGLLLAGIGLWRSRWLRWRVSERIGLSWRLDERDRRALAWRQLATAAEQLRAAEPGLTLTVEQQAGAPQLALRWQRADGQRVLLTRIGDRPDVIEVVALAGEPPVVRATWRVIVPDQVLYQHPSPFAALLERLRSAADALSVASQGA